MAKFCKYCGKQIDGGMCDCPQALAEAQRNGRIAGVDPRTGGEAQRSSDSQHQSDQVKMIGNHVKNLFIQMFTNPVSAFEQAAESPDKLPQYLIAAAYALLWIIYTSFLGKNDWVSDNVMFKIGISIALTAIIVRGVYAAGVYAFAKKLNPQLTLESALGVFCMAFAYDMALMVLQVLVVKTGIYEISIALVFFWLVMDAVTAYLLTLILTKNHNLAAFKITLILQLVILIILVFALRGMAAQVMKGIVSELQNSFMNGLFSSFF